MIIFSLKTVRSKRYITNKHMTLPPLHESIFKNTMKCGVERMMS